MDGLQPGFRLGVQGSHGTGPDALVRRAHVENPAPRLDEPENVVALLDELVEPFLDRAKPPLRLLPPGDLGPAPRAGVRETGRLGRTTSGNRRTGAPGSGGAGASNDLLGHHRRA